MSVANIDVTVTVDLVRPMATMTWHSHVCVIPRKWTVGNGLTAQLSPLSLHAVVGHTRQVEFMLQFAWLKEQHASSVSTNDNTFVWDPGFTQVVLLPFCLLYGKLFQVAFTVAKQLEDAIANNTELGVVLWVECNLQNILRWVNINIKNSITHMSTWSSSGWCKIILTHRLPLWRDSWLDCHKGLVSMTFVSWYSREWAQTNYELSHRW